VPITFVERARGRSKMSPMIVVEAMLKVTGWGIAGLFRRRPASSGRVVGS
jgi:dolichol-phosphate mannosyltransferase